ncbi:MAG: ferritin-like domain-containing protein [Janthinobacterium lividum]
MPTHVTLYFTANPNTAGTTAVAIPTGPFSALTSAPSPDIKVLNFALALETLEAQLYKDALARLTTGGTDSLGQTITGLGLATSELDVQYLTTFGAIEADHQAFLTTALGGNWAASAGAKFDFGFADTNQFGTAPRTRLQTIQLVYAAEQTGVSAYLGGAGPGGLTPGGAYLGVAASILGTEARHTTAVAALLNSSLFNETPKLATAPLATDAGAVPGSKGIDIPLAPDQILYLGGTVAADTTVAGDGKINPISGPNGFVFV